MSFEKKNRGRRIVVRILLPILLSGSLTGAFFLGKKAFDEIAERKAGVHFYEQLAKNNDSAIAASAPSHETSDNNSDKQIETSERQADGLTISKSEMDFDVLRETCPDIVGWLRIENTAIDYPIVQGEDNDFYLHHLPDRTPNSAGSIMMNYTNDSAFSDSITVLHGHHMRNGTMFNSLEEYNSEDYYLDHPMIHLFTPRGDYDVAVFAAYTVNGYSFGYATSFDNEADFETFIRNAVSSTGYKTDVEVTFGDRLLLLSTCAYSFEGARYLVIGKIIE